MSGDWSAGLEPTLLWQRFAELTRIPRPSKAEGPARDYVLAWAGRRGLVTTSDDEGNVVVQVPASHGREEGSVVVLQSHLDMVCERDPDSAFDPREGRIGVDVDGDWVVADETTLGADNGIGVAAALAVVDDDVAHGPLELLFTVSEERGLDGAKALDPSLVSGRLLVNLDGTSDGALTIGCAGSDHTFLRLTLDQRPVPEGYVVRRVRLSGARGGHSGGDIAAGRINAIKGLARVLSAAFDRAAFRLIELEGGVSRNAIPREAHATIALAAQLETEMRDAAEGTVISLVRQHAGSDDDLSLSIEHQAAVRVAASGESTRQALDTTACLPTGVLAMAPSLPGVVETSTSLTTAVTEEATLTLGSMTRSSNAVALDGVLASMEALARLSGAEIESRRSYPPWQPDLSSPLLATAKRTHARIFGAEPALTVVHGGLECAVLGQKLSGVEMVSIGPEIVGPHAPGEKVRISSTQRFYRLLGGLLDDLSS